MSRVAILGGGIAGLAAAYELEVQRRAGAAVEWQMFEASDRLGGIVQTTRLHGPDGEYILEGGPDAWVTEKPWARDLAEELGLGGEIISSRDEDKKTYVWLGSRLAPMPDGMRMMVPEDLRALEESALFSSAAKREYAEEFRRAAELKAAIPAGDESVSSFVRRHFGDEVLEKIGAPLLSGVFGGDTAKLSVRAVMPAFVKMEAEHGSLIAALQARRRERGDKPTESTFTTLRRGMGSLVEAIRAKLPAERLHLNCSADRLERLDGDRWLLRFVSEREPQEFDQVLIAVPVGAARRLLQPIHRDVAALVPADASSAVLTSLCWPAASVGSFVLPPGFGLLVRSHAGSPEGNASQPKLLAATFTHQKFPARAPAGALVIRAFFGGREANRLGGESDDVIAANALKALRSILPELPEPDRDLCAVSRWPRSLPQYEVRHLERMAELDQRVSALGGLHLLGNGYRGVGVPDLIRDARPAARLLLSGR